MRVALSLLLSLFIVAGCTTVNVHSVDPGLNLSEVCIEENPKVIVDDFLPVVRNGFDRHGVNTKVVSRPAPDYCEFILTYTAFKTWDIGMYMHHAELRLEQKGQLIGSAEYHLNGKGGLSMMKWQSTKTKMDPVIDQLLADINR